MNLFEMQDKEYKKFMINLLPTVDAATIIGIRTPILRAYAKKMQGKEAFMKELPHKYYEENNLHAFIIEQIRDYDECIRALNDFLPYVDKLGNLRLNAPESFEKTPYRTSCRSAKMAFFFSYIYNSLRHRNTYALLS